MASSNGKQHLSEADEDERQFDEDIAAAEKSHAPTHQRTKDKYDNAHAKKRKKDENVSFSALFHASNLAALFRGSQVRAVK
jgi:hypothetical protein